MAKSEDAMPRKLFAFNVSQPIKVEDSLPTEGEYNPDTQTWSEDVWVGKPGSLATTRPILTPVYTFGILDRFKDDSRGD